MLELEHRFRAVDRPFVAFARLDGPRDPRETPVARLKNLGATREDHHVTREDAMRKAFEHNPTRVVPALGGEAAGQQIE